MTLLYNPGAYFSVHNDLIFTVLDSVKANDPALYPNYKYICDVYIGLTLVARLSAVPRPDTKIGVFNVSNIIRNYVANNFNPLAGDLRAQELGENEFYVTAQLKFGEDYNFTTYPDVLVDSERIYFNHWNPNSISAYADKVISNRPYATKVYRNASFNFVPFMPSDDTNVSLVIKAYRGTTLLNTTTQTYGPTPGSSNMQQLYNLAPNVINAFAPGFINDTVEYYTVEFSTTNIVGDSIYRFNLFCEAIYEVFTLHFLNQFGGIESKSFNKVSRKSIDIDRSDFGKLPYTIPANGNPSYYNTGNVYNEQESVFAVQWKEKMALNSDFLTDAEYIWLQELIVSPQIYIEINGFFHPVKITAKDYELRKGVNDNLTNLTLTIEFGKQFNSQYR